MRAWLIALLFVVLWPRSVHAHPLSPPSLTLRESSLQRYEVTYRRSALAAAHLTVDWPSACRLELREQTSEADQLVEHAQLVCARALRGETLRVFGLLELELSMLIHLELRDGDVVHALLTPDHPTLRVPARSTSLEVLGDYLTLGVRHLLGGADHILFVLGLLLLLSTLRARLLALSAFTLGHSVTLCLSALSFVRLPQAPVELGIALSLLALAFEVLRVPEARVPMRQHALLMAGGFGLLHGLGFANALRETGLPAHAVPLALFGFNLGVELGQLLVVLALAPCLYLAERARGRHAERLRWTAAYAIGALAAMWCIERALTVF